MKRVRMRDQRNQPRVTVVFSLCLLAAILMEPSTANSRSFPYLYATLDDPNASYPVMDHLSPEHRGLAKDAVNRPDFLYHPINTYRIVEYYIHWCQTCRLFAPVFTKFAGKVTEMAAAQGVTVQVHAINCSPNRQLCLDQKTKDYPKIRLYRPNETDVYHEVGHHLQLHPYSVLDTLGITYDAPIEDGDWDVERELDQKDSTNATAHQSWIQRGLSYVGLASSVKGSVSIEYHRSRDDLKADIHLSFDYALRHDIFTSNEALTPEESKIFRAWLELILLSIPSSWGLADLLHELINNFIYVSKSHSYMVAVLNEFSPPSDTWSLSCSKGLPDQGYTCGLWELFHAITIGVVEYNEASFDDEAVKSVEDTARLLRDYVDHFFGCVTCREHFLQMFDNCELNRCHRLVGNTQWRQLPLWLFETHNAVSIRLMDAAAVWPKPGDCSLCWNEDDGSSYDAEVMYLYLKHEYGQRDPSTTELRRKLVNATKTRTIDESQGAAIHLTEFVVGHATLIGLAAVFMILGGLASSRRRKTKVD